MGNVFRCYAEKKPGFDVEARRLLGELKSELGLRGLTGVRILHRYDVEGIDAATYQAVRTTVLSEPQVDAVYDETFPDAPAPCCLFAVEALPGQYDQRADSCAQCIQLLTGGERPLAAAATVYILMGEVSGEELERVKKYLINPVESREAGLDRVGKRWSVPTPCLPMWRCWRASVRRTRRV